MKHTALCTVLFYCIPAKIMTTELSLLLIFYKSYSSILTSLEWCTEIHAIITRTQSMQLPSHLYPFRVIYSVTVNFCLVKCYLTSVFYVIW